MEIQTIAAILGLAPLEATTLFGLPRLRQLGRQLDRVRTLPVYRELAARRESQELTAEAFFAAVESLIAESSPESAPA